MKKFSKVFAVIMVVAIVAALGVVTAFATDGASVSIPDSFSSVDSAEDAAMNALEMVTSQISVSNVITIICAGVLASIGFFFMWFGVRWLIRKISAAIKTGRLPG